MARSLTALSSKHSITRLGTGSHGPRGLLLSFQELFVYFVAHLIRSLFRSTLCQSFYQIACSRASRVVSRGLWRISFFFLAGLKVNQNCSPFLTYFLGSIRFFQIFYGRPSLTNCACVVFLVLSTCFFLNFHACNFARVNSLIISSLFDQILREYSHSKIFVFRYFVAFFLLKLFLH